MNRQSENIKITALYERLSRDDEQQTGESGSITNQKLFLEDYATKNGFENICHFMDDGVSGTTFERKGFRAMIDEIEAGNVATVICKEQYVKQKTKDFVPIFGESSRYQLLIKPYHRTPTGKCGFSFNILCEAGHLPCDFDVKIRKRMDFFNQHIHNFLRSYSFR